MAVEPISQHETTQHCCNCPCCAGVDYSSMDSGELVQLILQTDRTRRKLEGLVAEMLVRLGELEGNGWVEDVCEQFGRGRHAAHRQAKGTWLLKGLAATLDATAEGLVSVDHARLIGESNQRVSFTSAQEVEINCVGCRLRATACEVHHIAWWEQGGTTNINNLVLLCPNCHTKIHKHGYTLTTDPKGRHRLKPPPPHKPHSRNPGAPP